MTPEDTARIQAVRAKVLADPAFSSTPEGMAALKEAITILRADRVGASTASVKSRTAKAEAAKPVDTGALLADLKSLGAKIAGQTF